MNACLPQVDLCSLVAHSSSGFCINTWENGQLITAPHDEWNEFMELLISKSLVCRHDALDGNLDWVPDGTLETQRRLVRASVPIILFSRLRDGYKLRHVRLLRYKSNTNPESCGSLTKSSTETQTETTEKSFQFITHSVQVELTMLWKVGIKFVIHIRGLWPDLHRIAELERINFGFDETASDTSLALHLKSRLTENSSTDNLHTCVVSFSISANYSFLHEVTCKRKYPVQNFNRASTISRFVMYHRHLSVTDQQIEHIFKFWQLGTLSKVLEQLPSGLSSVFTVIPDTSGKLIAVPSLLAHRLSANSDLAGSVIENRSQFFHFWRLFIERDLLECYRWLQIKNIYGILEHDSPLPPNLHLPPEGDRYTATVTCRQSLDRLHAFLSQWCTFTLLETTVYVRLLFLDDPTLRFIPCAADLATVTETQPSISPNDVGFVSKSRPVLSDHLSFFCVIRVELKIPEFRLRVGFVIGTPPQMQNEVISQLREQISALHFPPRGRQAIPKSRHKSGAPLPNNEWCSVPPLQRSWEDTPCCTIFHNRLDRLIVNTGVWSKRLFIGYRSLTPRSDRLAEQQFRDCCPLGRIQRPGLELSLLSQHLHHESKIWVIQPTTFSDTALRLLFCSLINLRFQEGFHLVRAGPQTGFVSLATEIEFCSSDKDQAIKCLVQYQLYPLGDARLSDIETAAAPSFSALDNRLKEAITQVIVAQKSRCSKETDSCSIFELPYDASGRSNYVFKFVQLVTELWIQPVEGRVAHCSTETRHWEGSSFTELSKHIFDVDRRCVFAYATLERLDTILRSSVSSSMTVRAATGNSTAYVKLDSVLGSLAPEASVEWARTHLADLTALSPHVMLLYSLLEPLPHESSDLSGTDSTANDFLLSQFCESLLCANEAREIYMSQEDSEEYTKGLCVHGADQVLLAEHPQWRCFILPGSISADTVAGCAPPEEECNPLVTVIFVPKLYRDASSEVVKRYLTNWGSLILSDAPFLPVFVYACSRVYLSFLIDDRWTYKVPQTSFFDLRHNRDHQVEAEANGTPHSVGEEIPLNASDKFLGVGRQNLRLTQELNHLWSSLSKAIRFTSRIHLDSFIFSVYHCLNLRTPVSDRDVEYVLRKAEPRATSKVLSVDLNPLLLLTCEQFLYPLQRWLNQQQQQQKSANGVSVANDALQTILSHTGPNFSQWGTVVNIPIDMESSISKSAGSCCRDRYSKYQQIMDRYLSKLEKHDTLFIVSKSPYKSQFSSRTANCRFEEEAAADLDQSFRDTNIHSRSVHSDNKVNQECDKSKDDGSNVKNEISRKRNLTDVAEANLIHIVKQWFTTSVCLTEMEEPLFVKIVAFVIYDNYAIPVHLNNGLPLFCFIQVKNALKELIKSHKLESTLFDLSQLKFELQISILHWPRHFESQTSSEFNATVMDTKSTTTVSKPFEKMDAPLSGSGACTDAMENYTCPLLIEDAVEVVSSWSSQSRLSLLTSFQRAAVCQFICRLLWQMEDDVVCSLRTLKPVLVPSIEFVLRHVEATDKLYYTPMFDDCGLIYSETCQMGPSRVDSNKMEHLFAGSGADRKDFASDTINACTGSFVEPEKMIKLDRIPLEFVSFSPEIFSYFVRQFEKIFVTADTCLEYLEGYYFVRSTSTRPRISASDRSRAVSVHNKPDVTYHPLLDAIIRRRSSDLATRPSRIPRTMDDLNNGLSVAPKSPPIRMYPRRYSSQSAQTKSRQYNPASVHAPSSLGYDGDTSDLGEGCDGLMPGSCPARIPCQVHTKRSNELLTNSEGSKLMPRAHPQKKVHYYTVNHQEVLPYWLIFRVCANSVSLFFHQSNPFVTQVPLGCLQETDIDPTFNSINTFTPGNLAAFHFACKSIHSVMKLVNQRILLNKLRNEGFCDELLMPKLSDVSRDQAVGRKGIQFAPGDKHFKSPVGRSRGLQSPSGRARRTQHPQQLLPVNSFSDDSSGEEAAGPVCTTRIVRERRNRSTALSSTSRVSAHSGNCSGGAWPPGYFACPVQTVSYIRLHPRILAATAHVGQKDRGRQIVSALRCLLEKPAINNRPDMFFLIDQAPSGLSSEPSAGFVGATAQNSLPTGTVSSLDEVPVFYMILKEGTPQSFKIDTTGGSSYDKCRLDPSLMVDTGVGEIDSMDDPQMSGVDDSKSAGGITKVLQSLSPNHLLSRSRNSDDLFLQITLHGIDTPSLRLCNFVRQILQQLLDDLVLQHFSDGLSRNAINRLTVEDLNFLSNRQPSCPQHECLIVLPRFLNKPTELVPHVPYGPHQLVLAFCHYLRQNLLLFLAAVKLDSDTQSVTGHQFMEWFLYNRPRAQGVAKPGVATLLFQLVISSANTDGTVGTHPYRVTDWTLPIEPMPSLGDCTTTTVELYQKAIVDVCEWSRDQPAPFDSASGSRLMLSLRLWQRGDADMNGLKTRIGTAVTHSLYDLITEFFVLTSPIKLLEGVLRPNQSSTEFNDKSTCVPMNPHFAAVVLPWFGEGRRIDTPLVMKTEVQLSSGILMDQFLTDFLNPFGNSLKQIGASADPDGSLLLTDKAGSAKPNQNLTSTPLGPGTPASLVSHGAYLSEVFFHVFSKESKTHNEYWLKRQQQQQYRAKITSGSTTTRPGSMRRYLVVGRNTTAWRRIVQRASTSSGCIAVHECLSAPGKLFSGQNFL
ncbi:unnamed protein product [Echinostoma caproni]|uniref:Uncharacterized protein n=1 Tax=Echinostoma caproni TaxID=27848 RepID=A0A183AMA4_9TREM|nr:unnamed protein product [Echinostoma caproni]